MRNKVFIGVALENLYSLENEYEETRDKMSSWSKEERDKILKDRNKLADTDKSLEDKISEIDMLIGKITNLEGKLEIVMAPYRNSFNDALMHYILSNLGKTERKKLKAAIFSDNKKREQIIKEKIEAEKEYLLSVVLGGNKRPQSYHTKKERKEIDRINQETRATNSHIYSELISTIEEEFVNYFHYFYRTTYIDHGRVKENDSTFAYGNAYKDYCKEHDKGWYPETLVKKCDYLLENKYLGNDIRKKIRTYKTISIELEKIKYLIEKIREDLHISNAYTETKKVSLEVLNALIKEQKYLESRIGRLNINIEELYKNHSEEDKKVSTDKFIKVQKIENPDAIVVDEKEEKRKESIQLSNMKWKKEFAVRLANDEYYKLYGKIPTEADREDPRYRYILGVITYGINAELEDAIELHKKQLIDKLREKLKKDIMLVRRKKNISDEEIETLIQHAVKSPLERYEQERKSKGKEADAHKFVRTSEKYEDSKTDMLIKKYLEEVERINSTDYLTTSYADDLMIKYSTTSPTAYINESDLEHLKELEL